MASEMAAPSLPAFDAVKSRPSLSAAEVHSLKCIMSPCVDRSADWSRQSTAIPDDDEHHALELPDLKCAAPTHHCESHPSTECGSHHSHSGASTPHSHEEVFEEDCGAREELAVRRTGSAGRRFASGHLEDTSESEDEGVVRRIALASRRLALGRAEPDSDSEDEGVVRRIALASRRLALGRAEPDSDSEDERVALRMGGIARRYASGRKEMSSRESRTC